MTEQQLSALRSNVIGPCSEEEKQEMREWLEGKGEQYETHGSTEMFPCVRWFDLFGDWGQTNENYITPTISFQDFKNKYINAEK